MKDCLGVQTYNNKLVNNPTEFRENRLKNFPVLLLTDKQINGRMDTGDSIT